jgi:hypothetical protein
MMGPPGMMGPMMMSGQRGGLFAVLEVDKIRDMIPPDFNDSEVLMWLIGEDDGKDNVVLQENIGPFEVRKKPTSNLYEADCNRYVMRAQGQLHFGGEHRDGAMRFRLNVRYRRKGGNHTQNVGTSEDIMISFKHQRAVAIKLLSSSGNTVGHIFVSYHLDMQDHRRRPGLNRRPGPHGIQAPIVGSAPEQPAEVPYMVRGRTMNFEPFSIEEANEAAWINAGAQNRAMLQRMKKYDINYDPDNGDERLMRRTGKTREWANLDALFYTMGPNPLAMSEEVGAAVCRGYQDLTSVVKEVGKDVGPFYDVSPADAAVNDQLLRQMSVQENPFKVQATVRPVICKSPDEIAVTKDMRWLPDPPMYVPVRNLSDMDKETLRLASYDPSQSAKLMFWDVTPAYEPDNDIWETNEEFEPFDGMLPRRRVKDECLMA